MNIPNELKQLRQFVLWNPSKLPLQPNGKPAKAGRPETWHSYDDCEAARTDGLGIGFEFATDGGLVGIDLDDAVNEQTGILHPWAQEIVDTFQAAGAWIEWSPSGMGLHIICRGSVPEGRKNTTKIEAGKLEVFDHGRYFTVTGETLGTCPETLPDCSDAMDWLATKMAAKESPKPAAVVSYDTSSNDERAAAYLATMDPSISGSAGHNAAYRAAMAMVEGFGLSQDKAYNLLAGEWNGRCVPPWNERELRHKVESAAKNAGTEKPIGHLLDEGYNDGMPTADFSGLTVKGNGAGGNGLREQDPATIKRAELFPSELLCPPGFLRDVIEFNLETAVKPQPLLALAGAVCLCAALICRKVKSASGTRPNLQVIAVGETTCGKDHSRQLNDEILERSGNEKIISPEEVTSDTALYKILESHPIRLFQADEFGRFLSTTTASSASHLYNVTTAMMKLYTSANRRHFNAKSYANSQHRPDIVLDQPHLVLHATSTPAAIYQAMGTASVEDGFLGRCLIFETKTQPRRQRRREQEIPERILQFARYWQGFEPPGMGNLYDAGSSQITIEATADAERVFDELDDYQYPQLIGDDKGAKLWGRAEQKAWQLALVYACSVNPTNPMIDAQAAEWACGVARAVTTHMVRIASDWLASNAQEALQQKLYRVIADRPGGITQGMLSRKSQWLKHRDRTELLASMLEAGLIYQDASQKPAKWLAN